jgi:hypothetical protein
MGLGGMLDSGGAPREPALCAGRLETVAKRIFTAISAWRDMTSQIQA